MIGLFKRKDKDIKAFFESLSMVKTGRNGYSKMDRYRDFRKVFGTEEGRRVLAQIVDHSDIPIVESEVSDTHKMAFRAGQRNLSMWIIKVLNAEPLTNQEQN